MGAPSKLTEELRADIIANVKTGMTQARAAQKAGVHPVTLTKWKRAFPEFGLAIDQSLAEFGGDLLATQLRIVRNDEHPKQWEALKHLLESRFPDDSPRIKKSVSEAMDHFFVVFKEAIADLPAETQDQIAEAIEHARESTLSGARHPKASGELDDASGDTPAH